MKSTGIIRRVDELGSCNNIIYEKDTLNNHYRRHGSLLRQQM